MIQVEAKSKLRAIDIAKERVSTWWRDLRRGYSDRDAAMWRHHAFDVIDPEEAEQYRLKWSRDISSVGFISPFVGTDISAGPDLLTKVTASQLSLLITSTPLEEVAEHMRATALDNLRQHRLMPQSETPPHPHPSLDSLSPQS